MDYKGAAKISMEDASSYSLANEVGTVFMLGLL